MSVHAIIQCRAGSTRMPGKTLQSFYGGKTIPQIIIDTVSKVLPKENIILATSTNPNDDDIVTMAYCAGVKVYRGDETDVAYRFVGACMMHQVDTFIRICADNPFLRPEFIRSLVDLAGYLPRNGYLSYAMDDGTPAPRSHLGLFGELTRMGNLAPVLKLDDDSEHREHVTSYIYGNPHIYDVEFMPMPRCVADRYDIRLTVDTPDDFAVASAIYGAVSHANPDFTLEELIAFIDSAPSVVEGMRRRIKEQHK